MAAGRAVQANDGAGEDDAAPFAAKHRLGGAFRGAEGAGEVRREDGIPIGIGHPQDEGVFGDPGVGDEDLDRAVGVFGGGERRLDLGGIGDVTGDAQHAVGGLARAAQAGDPMPVRDKPFDDGASDATVTPRNQGAARHRGRCLFTHVETLT